MENGGRREDLAKRIYQIMEEGHMKQSAVARAAGISPSLFNAMLRGRKIIRAEHTRASTTPCMRQRPANGNWKACSPQKNTM